ncbi:hypothetical protein CLW00_1115 [Mongoliibacter ruber]|uniref:Uncharacterized protein n=1 Tax=Mongoliibacter ruber TaxID=1750599 RepID=A0A2T0WG24_9BACT|nr:hypothetical protein CLW00_1115 [Mongoliibacter ruber]
MVFELIAQKGIESSYMAEIPLKSKCNIDPENEENRDKVEIKARTLKDRSIKAKCRSKVFLNPIINNFQKIMCIFFVHKHFIYVFLHFKNLRVNLLLMSKFITHPARFPLGLKGRSVHNNYDFRFTTCLPVGRFTTLCSVHLDLLKVNG